MQEYVGPARKEKTFNTYMEASTKYTSSLIFERQTNLIDNQDNKFKSNIDIILFKEI